MATYIENLKSIRDGIAQLIADEIEYQATNGPKPDYSLDGESVSWQQWITSMMERLDQIDARISMAGKTHVVSRGRPT